MANEYEVFGKTFDDLEKSMRVTAMRQEVIAHNIANANTPGYVAMTFDEELMQAIKKQDKKKVVLEDELAALSKNSIEYSGYAKMLISKLNLLRTVARQGK